MQARKIVSILVTVLAGIFSLAFAALFVYMLPILGTTVGTGAAEKAGARAEFSYVDAYERQVNNLSATAMEGIIPIPKSYVLPEDTVIAPEPNPDCFGQSADPADTAPILAKAAELLGGQETVWTTETPLRANSVVRWYLDDTIFSITWKQVIQNSVFTFTEVKIAHPSQFRRYLADNTFSAPVQYLPTQMAQTVNAVSAMSADFYKFRKEGIVVYQRQLYRTEGKNLDTCFVDGKGDLNFVHRGTFQDEADIQNYIDEHDILFSMSFGPILIENGENVLPKSYPIGEINDFYARAAIGQLGECHYLLVTVNHEDMYGGLHSKAQKVVDAFMELGVPNAYMLDGGQTASMIVDGELINSVEFGYQRAVSDIIYFATALPEQQKWEAEHG